MGERRHAHHAAASEGLRPLADYQEAYRLLHNLQAQYESLGTLKEVLTVVATMTAQYEALKTDGEALLREVALTKEELDTLTLVRAGLVDEIADARAQAQVAHEKVLEDYQAETEALMVPLQQARAELQTVQRETDALKRRMVGDVQQETAQARAAQAAWMAQMAEERTALQDAIAQLQAEKAQLIADIDAIVGRMAVR